MHIWIPRKFLAITNMKIEKIRVPLFQPEITKEDKKEIIKVLDSPILSDGPRLKEFESSFAKYLDTKYAVGLSSATAALQLSLQCLGIGKGDEVIVPDVTFVATANSVVLAGARPVFADIDPSLNILVDSLKKLITKKTKCIIVVHFAGQPANMNEIKKIANKNKIKIIEDCAHAIGAKYLGKYVGTFGDTGCFSFFATKNMTTLEGGMLVTNSKKIFGKAKELRSHGITKSVVERYKTNKPWLYDVPFPGYNFKLDELRSTIGLSQLRRIDKINLRRRKIAQYYNKKLKNIKGIELVNQDSPNHVYYLYIIRITKGFGLSRDEVYRKLKQKGIQTTVHYRPLHQFSQFRNYKKNNIELSNSLLAYSECLSLPMFTTITKNQQDCVVKQLVELSSR